ncbi:MAG TPA: DUF1080 domain-containing protein [Fimbriiglobus sp.]|jgi:hypothetical protein|nr:DUF1080 domain-containing protein [Fimbriiglobus sp.]
MYRRLLVSLAFCAALGFASQLTAADTAPPPGFTALFNGKNLAGWHGWAVHEKGGKPADLVKLSPEERAKKVEGWTADAKKHWRVENGELVNDGLGAYLATDKGYGDIELLIEYKTVAKADSGVYLRATPQVQIWDTTKEGGKWDRGADKGSGGLFNNSKDAPGQLPLVHADRPFGEWNKLRILQVGERTTVYLNDKLVVEHARMENYWNRKAPLARTGKVLLQTHGGEIRWRNVFVRPIPADEANAILAKHGADGFESVFNGKDFDGWAGPVENYEVASGAIVCKPGKGGTLHTKKSYGDFVARLEYKLPAGGNNGLAIRYPGAGDPAYAAMCEVQILDDTAEKYAKLDPRQYNGSPYGMIAARRGFLRKVGEWNFMEVTVKGSTIQVELNGTRIADGDLSLVKEYMAKSPHPGKDRTEGHFGFAGHSDPVAFRNVRIKSLK